MTNAGRKTLRRVFCFCVFTLFFLLNGQFFTYAQGSLPWPVDVVKPYFVADSARCATDGRVRYGFIDPNAPPGHNDTIKTVQQLQGFHLYDVRIYKKVNPTDSAHYSEYTGGEGVFHISVAGTYHIGLEAWSGHDGTGDHYVFDTVLTIGTNYTEPYAPTLAAYANMPDQYGNMPSFDCDSSGRIQIKIIGGLYPFKLYVWQDQGDDNYVPYDPKWGQLIMGPQSGQDSLKSDYWEYYSVDDLPPGKWRIQLEDSCHNRGQYAIQVIDSITPPELDHIEVLASGPTGTYNVVQIDAVLTPTNHEYCMRRATSQMEYQFYMEDNSTNPLESDNGWKPFPESGSTTVRLRDTVENVERACQMWGTNNKQFHFALRHRACGGAPQGQPLSFKIEGPQAKYFAKDSSYVRDSVRAINSCHNRYYRHLEKYSIHYETYQPSHYTTVGVQENKDEAERHRYHYTDSLTWTYVVGNTVIFEQKVAHINTVSSLSLTDLRDLYPDGFITVGGDVIKFDTTTVSMNVKRILKDAIGCELYRDSVVFNYDTSTTFQNHDWRIKQSNGSHCCDVDNTITLEEIGIPEAEPVGTTTIKLTTSPNNNFYNFEYTYNYATGRWVNLQRRPDNTATIRGGIAGRSLTIGEPCMPSGRYEFVIQSGNCGASNPISINANFGEVYETVVVSEPSHIEEQDCSNLLVTYTGGEVQRIRRKNNMATQIDPCTTIINVRGPSGGYCNSCDYHIGDHIPLSLPGMYVIKLSPRPKTGDRLCDESSIFEPDTIYYPGGSLWNLYAEALLCRAEDQVGNVLVKVVNGKLPFTYILYGKHSFNPDYVIDTNTTGRFYDVPFSGSDTLSCTVIDDCGAITNISHIYPKILETMQKVWFEDTDSDTAYVCEGDTVSVSALHMVDFFTYKWWYFDTTTNSIVQFGNTYHPTLFIHHGMPSGWYHVTIDETGCYEQLQDSVYLIISKAPSVYLFPKRDTICPGKSTKFHMVLFPTDTVNKRTKDDYRVSDSPLRYDSLSVSVAFANESGIFETRKYRGAPYDTITDSIITTSFTRIYPVWIVQDSSAACGYGVADSEDSIFVIMKPQNPEMLCSIEAKDTLVCYAGNAVLKAKKINSGADPYIINWYDDYAMTIPFGLPDTISGSQYAESDELQNLERRRLLFVNTVSLVGDECPAMNGITNNTVNLTQNGFTSLPCGQVYRFYDSGGPTGRYTANESIKHIFATNDGSRVLIHFDELDLSGSSHLYVVSGTNLTDSTLLRVLKKNDPIPDYLVSNSDTMMLYFVSGAAQPTSGWSAIIQHEPGIAVADVRPEIKIVYEDTVCQQSNSSCDLPISTAHKNILSSMGKLSQAKTDRAHLGLKKYEEPYTSQVTGCDSIVEFRLYVTAPPVIAVTDTVVTNLALPFKWDKNPGADYWESGIYESVVSVGDCNCDSIAMLYLTVLEVNISAIPSDTVCEDEESVKLKIEEIKVPSSLLPQGARKAAVGDVLCFLTTNRDSVFTLPPDTFILQASSISELHAMGVVFDVNGDGTQGRAIALRNAADTTCQYASVNNDNVTSGFIKTDQSSAIRDLEGGSGTINLRESAYNMPTPSDPYEKFKAHAPAAFYCYYYDSDSSCYSPTATSPTGRVPKGWYLPAAGELYRYFARRDIVNETMSKLKTTVLPKVVLPYDSLPQEHIIRYMDTKNKEQRGEVDSKYHTTTEKGSDIVYRISYKGLVNFNHNKYISIIIPGDRIVESSILPEWGLSKYQITHLNYQFANRSSNNVYWIYLHFARAIIQFEGNTIHPLPDD